MPLPKLGLIGLGKQGREHLAAVLTLHHKKHLTLVGICDTDEQYIHALSKEHHMPGYADYQQLLIEQQPDIVLLALPNNQYPNIIHDCLSRGIQVIKEKPYGVTLTEMTSFLLWEQQYKTTLHITQQRYFCPMFQQTYRWLTQETIGSILHFDYYYSLNDERFSWYWDKGAGGGCWLNVGWHFLFLLSWFWGTPSSIETHSIYSQKRNWAQSTEDTVFASVHYPTFPGRSYCSVVDTIPTNSFKIFGQKGTIILTSKEVQLINNKGQLLETVHALPSIELYATQLRSFLYPSPSSALLHTLNRSTMSLYHNSLHHHPTWHV